MTKEFDTLQLLRRAQKHSMKTEDYPREDFYECREDVLTVAKNLEMDSLKEWVMSEGLELKEETGNENIDRFRLAVMVANKYFPKDVPEVHG